MEITVSENLVQQISAHGAETYPHECCGALLGLADENSREVRVLHKLTNRREDSPHNRFSVTSEDVREAELVARKNGLDVIGWYHSHPEHPALPSEYDREHAWPWYSYIIVSVAEGKPGAIASWRLTDDRRRFEPETISSGVATRQQSSAESSKLDASGSGGSR